MVQQEQQSKPQYQLEDGVLQEIPEHPWHLLKRVSVVRLVVRVKVEMSSYDGSSQQAPQNVGPGEELGLMDVDIDQYDHKEERHEGQRDDLVNELDIVSTVLVVQVGEPHNEANREDNDSLRIDLLSDLPQVEQTVLHHGQDREPQHPQSHHGRQLRLDLHNEQERQTDQQEEDELGVAGHIERPVLGLLLLLMLLRLDGQLLVVVPLGAGLADDAEGEDGEGEDADGEGEEEVPLGEVLADGLVVGGGGVLEHLLDLDEVQDFGDEVGEDFGVFVEVGVEGEGFVDGQGGVGFVFVSFVKVLSSFFISILFSFLSSFLSDLLHCLIISIPYILSILICKVRI